jgi:hypothetical protein
MKGRISANLEKILRSPQGSIQLRRVLTNQTNEPIQVDGIRYVLRKIGQGDSIPTAKNGKSSRVGMS